MSCSKRSADQVIAALDFAVELVKRGVQAKDMIILTPYAANVIRLAQSRKNAAYESLSDMAKAVTIDGYQGQ